ncbi:CDP-6-deoxy-delta-3,4-glucoseen reductase [Diaphorobacter aerolatus]|uniref:CDP-6-deoxy-delta-3,4-glucoseen reductase n=1 Tax=Diaphorobacter aerolatus TaxID=1288495 RepID=A0A7H0GMR6_9BURK|nr:CDP-6-deoxy-delta-3,4-glucoseen reductase [Diaphorobacter aerolatus]QNP49582.1 CDP-6-deoxy-delta-3,4-glucoseen reductase [Diaphorobacter aerolatus]
MTSEQTTTAATFTISVQPSGRIFTAQDDETILTAAIRSGVGLPYSCKDGSCGSCKCKKLSGSVVHKEHAEKALSAAEEEAGFVLTCSARALTDVVLESRQVTDESAYPVKKLPVRVSSLTRASHDVMQVKLQLPAADHFKYHAGQYIEFILRDGARRAYSMATAPHFQEQAPGVELHIRHMSGGKFTDHVFGAMKERDILRVEGPFGSFFLREDSDKPIILLASGTGFAPVKALIEHMLHKGVTRPVALYWGGRRPADLYMDAWIRERAADMPNLSYVPVISNALPEDQWSGRTGFVHKAVLEDFADLSGYQVYACGAPIVVDSARSEYIGERGLPQEEFFADSFTSEADKHAA